MTVKVKAKKGKAGIGSMQDFSGEEEDPESSATADEKRMQDLMKKKAFAQKWLWTGNPSRRKKVMLRSTTQAPSSRSLRVDTMRAESIGSVGGR